MNAARQREVDKYTRAFEDPDYRMKERRFSSATKCLEALPTRRSLLDVGCGRGEILDWAREAGFKIVRGVEPVPELAKKGGVRLGTSVALPFPDKSFDVVTMFDVLEHLLESDLPKTFSELLRVARRFIVLAVCNLPALHYEDTLHITLFPYEEWDEMLRQRFSKVTWRKDLRSGVSETWVIEP